MSDNVQTSLPSANEDPSKNQIPKTEEPQGQPPISKQIVTQNNISKDSSPPRDTYSIKSSLQVPTEDHSVVNQTKSNVREPASSNSRVHLVPASKEQTVQYKQISSINKKANQIVNRHPSLMPKNSNNQDNNMPVPISLYPARNNVGEVNPAQFISADTSETLCEENVSFASQSSEFHTKNGKPYIQGHKNKDSAIKQKKQVGNVAFLPTNKQHNETTSLESNSVEVIPINSQGSALKKPPHGMFSNTTGIKDSSVKISSVFSLQNTDQRSESHEVAKPNANPVKQVPAQSSLLHQKTYCIVDLNKSSNSVRMGSLKENKNMPSGGNTAISFSVVKELEKNRLKEIIQDKIEKRYAQQLQLSREEKFDRYLKQSQILNEINQLAMYKPSKGSITPDFNYKFTRSLPIRDVDPEYQKLDSVYSSILSSILKNSRDHGLRNMPYHPAKVFKPVIQQKPNFQVVVPTPPGKFKSESLSDVRIAIKKEPGVSGCEPSPICVLPVSQKRKLDDSDNINIIEHSEKMEFDAESQTKDSLSDGITDIKKCKVILNT